MQSKVPLPTDNIYKFYALFGLLLLIASFYLFMSNYNDHRTRQHNRLIEISKLEAIGSLSKEQASLKELLNVQEKIDQENRKYYSKWISFFIALSIILIGYGFLMWQFIVQPKQDKLLELNTEKLEIELKILKKQYTSIRSSRFRKTNN